MTARSVDFSLRLALTGGEARGGLFTSGELREVGEEVRRCASEVEQSRGEDDLGFLELPRAYEPEHGTTIFGSTFWQVLERMEAVAERVRAEDGDFIHLGIGGSALGAITLVDALGKGSDGDGHAGRVHIPDNVDPDWIEATLRNIDLSRVHVNVVSKSGSTVETIAVFAVLLERLRQSSGLSPEELRQRIFVTTNPERGALAELARTERFQLLPLPDVVHGRFSVLSPMGLLAAAVAGVDLRELLAGARRADSDTAEEPFDHNPAQQLAALHHLGMECRGISVLVLLPYSNRLRTVADWYSQLVAESLGKNGQGVTPVKALGATDQHSQLQLYNDGPKDKLVVFFAVGQHQATVKIPDSISAIPAYAYLANRTLNDLLDAERRATEVSLHHHGVPSCSFTLGELDPFSVGYLLTVLEKAVCILGRLRGVNAFDQPGVEESKEYTRAMLGKPGESYDQLRARVNRLSKG